MTSDYPFGPFPGAREIGPLEVQQVSAVVQQRSPYRLYGLNPQHACLRLEEAIAARLSADRSVVALSSGTAALHTALYAMGVTRESEVILPAYGWVSDLMAVLALGATPVIAPVDDTLGLRTETLRDIISPRTRAVVAIHMRGQPCNIVDILAELSSHGIPVVEDCSQALGATIDGAMVGSFGETATFSFQYNKLLTSGEGGAIALSDPSHLQRAKWFHDCGMLREYGDADPMAERAISGFGLNYRMTELQAAMLLPQFGRLDDLLARLEASYQLALGILEPLLASGAVSLRPSVPGGRGNGAFLGLVRSEDVTHAWLEDQFVQLGLPVSWVGSRDPHHADTWVAFMERESLPFRDCRDGLSLDIMATGYMLDLYAVARMEAEPR